MSFLKNKPTQTKILLFSSLVAIYSANSIFGDRDAAI